MAPGAWTASTWSRTPRRRRTRSAISATGAIVPTSLLAKQQRHEDRLVCQRRLERVGVEPAVTVDRHLDDLEAELLEVRQGVPHGVMLDARRHDPVAACLAGPRGALEREVDRLGAAGREDDLARLHAERARHEVVRVVEGSARAAPGGVRRRRVAERLR